MSSRRATDGGSVLSFTFLDVLMCTMGSLLLLLVVFGVIAKKSTRARREGEEARISLAALKTPDAAPTAAGAEAPPAATDSDPVRLARELEQVRAEQVKLEQMKAEAAERRREEAARIAHLEDHERRLEHDLGKLHVALQALAAAEQKQAVDQQQAEAEARRLKELIRETETRLDDMRKANTGDKSYAIVPYKGASGTSRRPVFIECTADAVTIQPEGIRLTVEDFDGPLRSGNPLAAAVRAAHEELNGRAVAARQANMPDPYPLLIVRPNGAAAYAAALDAIRSWDSDYGYEFVEADWKLKYPEPDPRLGQVMAHAVDEARQRQALLARVAPRRYGPRLSAGGVGGGLGGANGPGLDEAGVGGGFESLAGGAGDRIGERGADGALSGGASGNPLRTGASAGAGGNFMDEFAGAGGAGGSLSANGNGTQTPGGVGAAGTGQLSGTAGPGAMGSSTGPQAAGASTAPPYGSPPYGATPPSNGGASAVGVSGSAGQRPGAAASGSAQSNESGGGSGATDAAGAGTMAAEGSPAGGMGAGGATAAGGGTPGGAASAATGAASGGMGGLPPVQLNSRRRKSAAESRGVNWANAEASRNAAAITRPIKVHVNSDQLLVLDADGRPADAGSVTFQQPIDGVMDALAGAIKRQIADWGLAGNGMYWRPTLVVSVAPGAERQAERLAELLENSGVDVRLPQATASAAGGNGRVAR